MNSHNWDRDQQVLHENIYVYSWLKNYFPFC